MIISQLTMAVIIMCLLDQSLKFMMRYRFCCILFVQLTTEKIIVFSVMLTYNQKVFEKYSDFSNIVLNFFSD